VRSASGGELGASSGAGAGDTPDAPVPHPLAKVLLVDDLEANLIALGEVLRAEDVRILCARSGESALELLLEHEVALAIIDVHMPGMDGVELAELMRGVARTRHVPIIFVSAGTDDRERRFRGYDAGAVDFLLKPLDARILQSKARVFLDLHRHAQALVRQRDALRAAVEEQARLLAERTAAEARLRESETRFRAMADGLPLMVWVHDANGDQEFVNETFCEFFGVRPEAVRGQGWQALVHPEDGPAYRDAFLACVRNRVPFRAEVRVRNAEGAWRHIESWGRPRFAASGEFLGMVGTSADMTDRKEAEAAIRSYAERLQAMDQRKDQFLAMLAHELRNPLAPLANVVEIMKRQAPRSPDLTGLLERQVRHLTRLVDDLLDVARVRQGKIRLQRVRVDLARVVHEATEFCRPLFDAHAHRLEVVHAPRPVSLEGDPARLTQVLCNLLNNAAKYTDDGGHVELRYHLEADHVVIAVRDNGRGIAPELVPCVFDLFTQGERTLDRSEGGLGVGLSLVKRLVELHGGTIEATSDGLGCGSRFTVRLPLRAAGEDAAAQGGRLAGEAGDARVLSPPGQAA
jgi:PAS domain S-box-containing protein